MKLDSSFPVQAGATRVFDLFLDAPTMRSCIPGCEELIRVDETHYAGRLVNQVAHVRFNAAFSVEIVSMDSPRKVRAVLKGEDNKLASSIKLDAVLLVESAGADASTVSYSMEMALWGKLGRMGESIFRRRTAEVEREFVEKFSFACRPEVALVGASEGAGGRVSPHPARAVRVDSPGGNTAASRGWWRRLVVRLFRRSSR